MCRWSSDICVCARLCVSLCALPSLPTNAPWRIEETKGDGGRKGNGMRGMWNIPRPTGEWGTLASANSALGAPRTHYCSPGLAVAHRFADSFLSDGNKICAAAAVEEKKVQTEFHPWSSPAPSHVIWLRPAPGLSLKPVMCFLASVFPWAVGNTSRFRIPMAIIFSITVTLACQPFLIPSVDPHRSGEVVPSGLLPLLRVSKMSGRRALHGGCEQSSFLHSRLSPDVRTEMRPLPPPYHAHCGESSKMKKKWRRY